MSLPAKTLEDETKIQLLKDTICKDSTNEEFELFAYTCKRMGLDPFARQIFPVKRWDSNLKRMAMTIQTSIDGYRLIADRTGRYAPGREPVFSYDNNGRLTSATAYVMKMTRDGKWHEVAATAHFSEYVGMKKDGSPNNMWATKPHIMLGKCAESLALRKAFPAELSGTYTDEEMDQASNPDIKLVEKAPDPNLFINKWAKVYDRDQLLTYVEKKAAHFKKETKEVIKELALDENAFIKEFEYYIKKTEERLQETEVVEEIVEE